MSFHKFFAGSAQVTAKLGKSEIFPARARRGGMWKAGVLETRSVFPPPGFPHPCFAFAHILPYFKFIFYYKIWNVNTIFFESYTFYVNTQNKIEKQRKNNYNKLQTIKINYKQESRK